MSNIALTFLEAILLSVSGHQVRGTAAVLVVV